MTWFSIVSIAFILVLTASYLKNPISVREVTILRVKPLALITAPIDIGNGVWIATDCFVAAGVKIGS